MESPQNSTYRYERKFFVYNSNTINVEQHLKHHSAFFSDLYHERFINNIYFDYENFNNFMDNINGNKDRIKYRIRWYGDTFSKIKKPVLEIKIKNGSVGTKKLFHLNAKELYKGILAETIEQWVSNSELEEHIKLTISEQNPMLLNSYRRKYFISSDRKFRLTMDDKQCFYPIKRLENKFTQKFEDKNNLILELKYDKENEEQANEIISELPYRLTKSSKYARGIELFYSI